MTSKAAKRLGSWSVLVLGLATVSCNRDTPSGGRGEAVAGSLESNAPEAASRSARPPAMESWRRAMRDKHATHPGCSEAKYPDATWKDIPCSTGIELPLAIVGQDYMGIVPGASIYYAEGDFPSVTGVTSEHDTGTTHANNFSLQINTNPFSTSLCANSPDQPYCYGFQQFIYDNNAGNVGRSQIYIEYWLVNYNTSPTQSCPSVSGMNFFPVTTTSLTGGKSYNCVYNTLPITAWISNYTISSLSGDVFAGYANTNDEVTFYNSDGTYKRLVVASVLGLTGNWNRSEFNVFGYGNGSQAVFNAGSAITVHMSVDNGTSASPEWQANTATQESNNMQLLSGSVCPSGGRTGGYGALTFVQYYQSSPGIPFCLQDEVIPPSSVVALF